MPKEATLPRVSVLLRQLAFGPKQLSSRRRPAWAEAPLRAGSIGPRLGCLPAPWQATFGPWQATFGL